MTFLKKNIYIYLYIYIYAISFWLHWMLVATHGLFVVACGLLFSGGARASEHGLSSCNALA